jgi:hypothetical protein
LPAQVRGCHGPDTVKVLQVGTVVLHRGHAVQKNRLLELNKSVSQRRGRWDELGAPGKTGRRPESSTRSDAMTEAEWNACTDPVPMLTFLQTSGRASERKLRLFACACCRRLAPWYLHEASNNALKSAEWYADGKVSRRTCEAAYAKGQLAVSEISMDGSSRNLAMVHAAGAAAFAAGTKSGAIAMAITNAVAAEAVLQTRPRTDAVDTIRLVAHCDLLRDIVGPRPFRSMTFEASRQTPVVLTLAKAAYGGRLLPEGILDSARLEVLAAVLEAAGCDDANLLGHLREPGPHCRGCWAIDLILGKV